MDDLKVLIFIIAAVNCLSLFISIHLMDCHKRLSIAFGILGDKTDLLEREIFELHRKKQRTIDEDF